jgi:hypothetical protein
MGDRLAQEAGGKMQGLLETSVSSWSIGKKILICSSCIVLDYPDVKGRFKDYTKLFTCLTTQSFEKVAWKLLTMARINKPVEIAALTMDGSPHCLQLHFALEDLRKIFPVIKIRHFIIEKEVIHEVSGKAVRTARHLGEIEAQRHA